MKRLRIRLIIGLMVAGMFSCLSLHAQTKVSAAQAKTMIAKINAAAAKIRTIQCDFQQTKTLSFLNDKMVSKGVMSYDHAGKLRWEYTSPYSYVFIINNNRVHIKTSKNSNTIDIRSSRLFQGIARVMMNSVTGKSLSNDNDFSVEMMTQGDEWIASLTPKGKEMKALFKTIRLHFDSQKQMVSKVEMIEKNGDNTVIQLMHVKTNGKIEESTFAIR